MRKKSITGILLFISYTIAAQSSLQVIPEWQEGEMEIHHIFAGGGESVFCIFPDGIVLTTRMKSYRIKPKNSSYTCN